MAVKELRRCVRAVTLNDDIYEMGRYKQNIFYRAEKNPIMLQND